jgi:hypothetical protein
VAFLFKVIAMIDTTDFFHLQADQCRAQAARAGNKTDREFWLDMARRWDGMPQGGPHGGETEPPFRKYKFVRTGYTDATPHKMKRDAKPIH